MIKKILVALDRSEAYQPILNEALSLAKATHSSLLLFHVLRPFDQGYPYPMYPSGDAYPALYDEAIQQYTQQLQELEQEGILFLRSLSHQAMALDIPAEYTQSSGDPGKLICEAAENWHADTIIMGRRGRSGLQEVLLGSVSNYVLHHAPCSVMIIQGILSDSQALNEYLDVC
jgi:nucleotide-binding universal stress UspA family protein